MYQCNDANAIPTRLRYAGTYAAAITGRYGWEGLGGLGLGCEWLAGLVWEGLDCVGFVVEITAASSNNGCGRVLGLVCMGRNRVGSNLAIHFDFFHFFFPVEFF